MQSGSLTNAVTAKTTLNQCALSPKPLLFAVAIKVSLRVGDLGPVMDSLCTLKGLKLICM